VSAPPCPSAVSRVTGADLRARGKVVVAPLNKNAAWPFSTAAAFFSSFSIKKAHHLDKILQK